MTPSPVAGAPSCDDSCSVTGESAERQHHSDSSPVSVVVWRAHIILLIAIVDSFCTHRECVDICDSNSIIFLLIILCNDDTI